MVLLRASAESDFEPALVSAVRQRADARFFRPTRFLPAGVPTCALAARRRHARSYSGDNMPTLVD